MSLSETNIMVNPSSLDNKDPGPAILSERSSKKKVIH